MKPKQNQHPGVDVTGDGSKVWCYKQQHCIGIWNVRSMDQEKLDMVKQKMGRVNTDILRISELEWVKFNCEFNRGQESLRRNGVAIIVNKRVWNVVLGCNLKNDRMISVHFQGKPSNIMVIQVYAPNSNAEEAEVERFDENLWELLEITPKKTCPFHYSGLKCKTRKSRNTWSNRQIWSWNTEWSRTKTKRVLPRECTGRSKHPLPTAQEKALHMDITRWSIQKSDWLYSLQPKMEKLYLVSKNKTRNWLWLRSWTPYCHIHT